MAGGRFCCLSPKLFVDDSQQNRPLSTSRTTQQVLPASLSKRKLTEKYPKSKFVIWQNIRRYIFKIY